MQLMVLKIHYEKYFNLNNVVQLVEALQPGVQQPGVQQLGYLNIQYLNIHYLVEEGQVQGARATKLQQFWRRSTSTDSYIYATQFVFGRFGFVTYFNVQETGESAVRLTCPSLTNQRMMAPPDLLPKHLAMQQFENEADRSEVEMLSGMRVLIPATDEELTEEFRLVTITHGGKGPQVSRT